MLGLGLGLLAGAAWGVSDFFGGLQARRISALAVLVVSQPIGLALAFVIAIVFHQQFLSLESALIAVGGGIAIMLGLAALYSGMARGSISVVAPIAAFGVVIPAVAGFIGGEQPGTIQIGGLVIALCGAALLSCEDVSRAQFGDLRTVGLALCAAAGIGTSFLALDHASAEASTWAVVMARSGSVCTLLIVTLLVKPLLPDPRRLPPMLIAVGVLDITAVSTFALATTKGLLPLVSVAAALHPAVTVGLARGILDEPLRGSQQIGAIAALAGVLLMVGGA